MKLCWSSDQAVVNGLQLNWETTGAVSGEPLLMVMGLGGQLIHWPDALCEALVARGFRLIRFDNRDAGLSAEADRGLPTRIPQDWLRGRFGWQAQSNYTLMDLARDTEGLMDLLSLPRAHLVGVSMGGMVAQILAATRPARVSSLTAIMTSTNHPRLPVARFDVLWRMAGLGPRPQTREAVIRRTTGMLQRVGSPGYPTPLDYRRRLAGRAYDRAFRPRGVARQTHAIVATGSFEPLLADIRAPTQVVHGLADPLLRPACGQRCAQVIPGARLELVAGMGHDFALPLMPRWAELIGDNAGRA
jgi:pimeloyl-ACP methyl ester carboxylesterase